MRIIERFVKKSQKFTPVDEKGGTLTWRVEVVRPGFRTRVETRSVRKDYHIAEFPAARDGAPVETT